MIGNSLEAYDFSIYGYFAVIISNNFFPESSVWGSIIKMYSIFAIGFLARPIGALIYGYIGDIYGRKLSMYISIITIAISTGLIGLLPSKDIIGVFAPILLIILRFIQGLSLGGEYTGSIIYILENTRKNKTFYGSLAIAGGNIGLLLASIVSYILTSYLSNDFLHSYGWRIAFIIAFLEE